MELFFFIYFAITVAHSIIDAKTIEKKKSINHNKEFTIVASLTAIAASVIYFTIDVNWLVWIVYCVSVSVSVRMGFYDFMLNELRGLPLDYVSVNADGNYTGKKESWYDDFLTKVKINPNIVRLISMFISFAIFVFVQIYSK